MSVTPALKNARQEDTVLELGLHKDTPSQHHHHTTPSHTTPSHTTITTPHQATTPLPHHHQTTPKINNHWPLWPPSARCWSEIRYGSNEGGEPTYICPTTRPRETVVFPTISGLGTPWKQWKPSHVLSVCQDYPETDLNISAETSCKSSEEETRYSHDLKEGTSFVPMALITQTMKETHY